MTMLLKKKICNVTIKITETEVKIYSILTLLQIMFNPAVHNSSSSVRLHLEINLTFWISIQRTGEFYA